MTLYDQHKLKLFLAKLRRMKIEREIVAKFLAQANANQRIDIRELWHAKRIYERMSVAEASYRIYKLKQELKGCVFKRNVATQTD